MIITIGDPVPTQNAPKNQYQLEVTYMSGDADSYATEKFMFPAEGIDEDAGQFTLENALKILHAYKNADWNSKCRITYIKLPQLLNIDRQIINDAGDNEFFPGDVTCDHQYMAIIDSHKLFYWSKEGIKHNVSITWPI